MISLAASAVALGQIGGAMVATLAGDYLGRKVTLTLAAFISGLGWAMLVASSKAEVMILARVITGIGMGTQGSLHSAYVCEITKTSMRGKYIQEKLFNLVQVHPSKVSSLLRV